MPVCRTNPTSGCALPLSYTAYHIYSKHHRSRLNCFALAGIPFSPALPKCLRSLCCDLIATIQPTSHVPHFPRPYTTTYLSCMLLCYSNRIPSRGFYADSEITFSRWQYFTTLFHAVSFHTIWLFASSLFRCRFGSTNRLPQCYNMSAYLLGLLAARPSAFVEGGGLEPPAHPKLFRESSPMVRTVVAY